MAKNPIYKEDPQTIRYMGHRYVLAAEEGAEATEDNKPTRPTSARIRVDRCKYNGVKFTIDVLTLESPKRILHGGKATSNDGNLTLNIRPVRKEEQIPQTIWDNIPENGEGTAVRARIDKALGSSKGSTTDVPKRLYLIQVEGGWRWEDTKNGTKGLEDVHAILKYIEKDRPSLLYVYCANSLV